MESIKVHLFAPGVDAGGVLARAQFAGLLLRISYGDTRLAVPAERLTVKHGGFDGRQWLLEWPGEGGTVAVLLPSSAEAERLLAGAPAALAAQLDRHGRRDRARSLRFRIGFGLVGAFVLLPFILLGLFLANADRIAGWAAGQVSLAQEQQLGDLAFAQMRPSLKLVEAGPAPAMVQAIGDRLTAGSKYHYQWFVADSPEVNAFAMPGGYVVVYSGLIRTADSAEEVAGVLAHEVQHVELRHSLKNMIHGLGWRALLALAMGDASGGIWAGMAEQLGGMAYGRDLERQADLGGLKALKRAGIAPDGLVGFFARLAQSEGAVPAFLSSHPATAERIDNLRRAIAAEGDYPAAPLPYDWAAIRAAISARSAASAPPAR
ncbi:MAG: M48 family metallopeptidase [Gallionellaceae bacterium]|nr:M48 family metallopeptidase [Gallionellaceae bacterium]